MNDHKIFIDATNCIFCNKKLEYSDSGSGNITQDKICIDGHYMVRPWGTQIATFSRYNVMHQPSMNYTTIIDKHLQQEVYKQFNCSSIIINSSLTEDVIKNFLLLQ